MGIEQSVIQHCAPTLAGMKAAGLFNFFYEGKEEIKKELDWLNGMLNPRGVWVQALLWKESTVLVYVYRKKQIEASLSRRDVQELLKNYGYEDFSLEKSLLHLKKRLHGYKCFPHEIGIFLGYPLENVKGFIDNKGKNCQSCGFWKVYCNAGEKEALFDKYRKCTRIYRQVFEAGRKLPQMTVVM